MLKINRRIRIRLAISSEILILKSADFFVVCETTKGLFFGTCCTNIRAILNPLLCCKAMKLVLRCKGRICHLAFLAQLAELIV